MDFESFMEVYPLQIDIPSGIVSPAVITGPMCGGVEWTLFYNYWIVELFWQGDSCSLRLMGNGGPGVATGNGFWLIFCVVALPWCW